MEKSPQPSFLTPKCDVVRHASIVNYNNPVNLSWAALNGLVVLPPRGQESFVFSVTLVSVIISFISLM
jgi:hypothetical protein